MFLIALALLLWIGAGVGLFQWKARPNGSTFRRAVDRNVVPVGGNVRVSLQLIPPSSPVTTVEPHDVMLLLDHSSSMGDGPGSALAAAVRAAENFVRRCPAPVRIGLVSFSDNATTLSAITSDHDAVLRGLQSIVAGGGTSIDAALAAAIASIEATPERAPRTTVILLSDGASNASRALEQAERLRELARIITIGFSSTASASLLTAIAGPTGRFCHVAQSEELSQLFATLAAFVSSETAVAGIVEEPASAPAPFQIAHTGTFHPIAVQGDGNATIAWSVPVMDPGSVSLSYDLVPDCPGWHSVARSGGRAAWQLPDGSQQIMTALEGPRVLVMPSWLVWSWPLLNPLFWMLFGRFFCRSHRDARVEVASETPQPLAIPSLPAPLQPPQPALYETRVRPAVIVGVGEIGERAVAQLGHLLADRGVGSGTIELIAVRATFEQNREPVRIGTFALADEDRIDLRQDLRPYLETLRSNPPAVRRWIPVIDWLGRTGPRTSDWIHDRREARLALLQCPEALEARLGKAIAAMKSRGVDETALVIGSALDAECSGMLAEVAHVLSASGAQTTAVVSRPRIVDDRSAAELDALAHELERMLLMRGDDVLSDRHEPPASARQLLDRLVVLREDGDASASIAGVAWQLLAYPDVLRRVPMARPDPHGRHMECAIVEQSSLHLPAESLWRWVRARSLARAVNGMWLATETIDGTAHVDVPQPEAVAKWVNAFWSPSGLSRPQSLLVRSGAALIGEAKDSAVLTLRGRLPAEALYGEQAAFAERERQTVAYFVEGWSQALIDEAYAQRRCGLPLLGAALREIESGLVVIQRRLAEAASDSSFAGAGRLGVSLYSDLAAYLERFRNDVERACAAQLEPLCGQIDALRRKAEMDVLFPSQPIRDEAERLDASWYQRYGAALLDQLRVRFVQDGRTPRVVIELAGKIVDGDVLAHLEHFLAPNRAEVLSWPLANVLDAVFVEQPSRRFRIGAPAARMHPDVLDVVEDADPYLAATLFVDHVTANEALGVRDAGVRRLPYAWPEEANAVRIASLVTNVLERRPHPFSPPAVHLLRDTGALHEFFADLAEARIAIRNGRCWLSRGDVEYWIGESATAATAPEALANFERMARQAALLRRSLDAVPIPARELEWNASPEEAVSHVESNDVVQTAIASEGWDMWRDVIRGVVLDAEQKRAAKVA